MKRANSKAVQLRKRIKAVQGRAKLAGVLYLLGTLALVAVAACMPVMDNAKATLSIMKFYAPLTALFEGGLAGLKSLTVEKIMAATVALLYVLMLLGMVINVLRSIPKLNWLFKLRASYSNGFNRNMYAMDDLAKRFSGTFTAAVIFNLFIYILSGDGVTITMYGYVLAGVGLAIHFLAGLIGGTVTLFTVGDHVEEEEREHGLFVYFVRNLLQLAATAAIVYFLLAESVLVDKLMQLLDKVVVNKEGFSNLAYNEFIPAGVELVCWIFISVLIAHATAATEFNRECMEGAGMKNFRVFSFFVALAAGALVVLPYLGIGLSAGATAALNTKYLIVAAIAFVAFLLDCIVKSSARGTYDDADMDNYFFNNTGRYNNTIV